MRNQISIVIQIWSIDRLIVPAPNPRKNKAALNRMCGNIREFGFKIPCLVRGDGGVIDGHLRLEAARKLCFTGIPVILCDDWTTAQINAFRLLVSQSATWADWNEDLTTLKVPGAVGTACLEDVALVPSSEVRAENSPGNREQHAKAEVALVTGPSGSSQIVGHGSKYYRKKEQAIAALLTHGSVGEAARDAGVGTQTLYRWLKNQEFKDELRLAKNAVVGQAIAILQQGARVAAEAMLNILIEPGAQASTRLKAADLVLRHAKDAIDKENNEAWRQELESNRRFEMEVARVEKRVGEGQKQVL